jgi:hypothetical protein
MQGETATKWDLLMARIATSRRTKANRKSWRSWTGSASTCMRFKQPFAGIASTALETVAFGAGKTKVTWGMSSAMNYPMNLVFLFMNMENLLGNALEISLPALKKLLEQRDRHNFLCEKFYCLASGKSHKLSELEFAHRKRRHIAVNWNREA